MKRNILNVIIIVIGFVIFHTFTTVYGIITATSFLLSMIVVSGLLVINGAYYLYISEKTTPITSGESGQ